MIIHAMAAGCEWSRAQSKSVDIPRMTRRTRWSAIRMTCIKVSRSCTLGTVLGRRDCECYVNTKSHPPTSAESQMAYISDSMGYHKVGNPSRTIPAVTMHLYCPPFATCKIWLDPDSASTPSSANVCFHSAYGELLESQR
jgi:hypothetical protein